MDVYSLRTRFDLSSIKTPLRLKKNVTTSPFPCLGRTPIVPSKIQGQFSYTVFSAQATTDVCPEREGSNLPVTNAKIVQFRLDNTKVDIYVAQLAKAVHGDIAPETDFHGEIGQEAGASFSVYLIQRLPGVSKKMNSEVASKQLGLIEDIARYAKSRPS